MFTDPHMQHVKALAFTIKASNPFNRSGRHNWVAAMQDIEYKKAGWQKMLQSQMGSALYPHGAISLWEKEMFTAVLKNHNTMFDGEDLQMGVILHSFNEGYTIQTVSHVSVETEVPSHCICWNWATPQACEKYPIPIIHTLLRFLEAPFKCGTWGCGYGEKSLFRQRVCSWDKGAHRAFLWYLKLLLFNWSFKTICLKPYLLYELWAIINDWTWPWLLAVFFTSADSQQLASFAQWMIMIVMADVLMMIFMDEYKFVERRDMRCGPLLCLSFTVYKYVLKLLRLFALVYNLVHYFPREEEPKVIADRGALPATWDRSEIFLDKAEADAKAVKFLRWVNSYEIEAVGSEDTCALDETTIEILKEYGDQCPGDCPGETICVTRHLYRDQASGTWVQRAWQTSDSWGDGSDGAWVIQANYGDKPGGTGMKQDLERFAVALEWAGEVFGSAAERGEFLDSDRTAVRKALTSRRAVCLNAPDRLEDMRRDGKRVGREGEVAQVRHLLSWSQGVALRLGRRVNTVSADSARQIQLEIHVQTRVCWAVARSLAKAQLDPDKDVAFCIMVMAAIGLGAILGTEWHQLDDHAESLGNMVGVPQDWVWFLALLILISLCGVGSLLLPLYISRAQQARQMVNNHSRLGKKST